MLVLRVGEPTDRVLNDHNCTIDNDAEIKSAKAHQIGTHLVGEHPCKREQHCQRYDHRRDQRCSEVAEKQKQDRDNQDGAFDQILFDGGDSFLNQIGTVIHGDSVDTLWQRPVDFSQLRSYRLGNCPTVLTNEHEDRAKDNFATIFGRCS